MAPGPTNLGFSGSMALMAFGVIGAKDDSEGYLLAEGNQWDKERTGWLPSVTGGR